jgi:hypothetical protein
MSFASSSGTVLLLDRLLLNDLRFIFFLLPGGDFGPPNESIKNQTTVMCRD